MMLMATRICQRTVGTAHIVAALRGEAFPKAASGVSYAGQKDEGDEEGLHVEVKSEK
jgi:hypothetical protein